MMAQTVTLLWFRFRVYARCLQYPYPYTSASCHRRARGFEKWEQSGTEPTGIILSHLRSVMVFYPHKHHDIVYQHWRRLVLQDTNNTKC